MNTMNFQIFPTHSEKYKLEKILHAFWRDKGLKSLEKYEEMYPCG